MSNRARALEYAASVQQQNRDKRNRPKNFTHSVKSSPPSYAFVDNQRGEIDDTAEKTRTLRREEEEIEGDKQRDVVDKNDFHPGQKTGKAPTPPVVTVKQTETPELKSAFRKCWTTVDQINIPLKAYDEKSSYVPNAIMLFNILFHLEEILNGNEELRWVSPSYFSLPVRVYYAVIFFVQILRAKEQAGKLEKAEGSWLRAFFRRYKDTLCPIVGPLVPFFTNIVSVLPDDNQFEFVYPTMEKKGTYSSGVDDVTKRTPKVRDSHLLVPSVPLISSLLRDFCTTRTLGDEKFDELGNYIPFDLTVGGDFAGITFPPNFGAVPQFAKLMANPVLMKPLPESRDRLIEIHSYWRRSGVRHIPDIPINTSYDPETPSGWTQIGSDPDWFQACVHAATTQCKFFSDNSNLSAIPTTGGNSALVIANLKLDENPRAPKKATTWFADKYSSMKSKFESSTAELDLDDSYQATFALTNATLSWTEDGHRIGSVGNELRSGPFFSSNKTNYELDYYVPVGNNLFSTIQSMFYQARGNN